MSIWELKKKVWDVDTQTCVLQLQTPNQPCWVFGPGQAPQHPGSGPQKTRCARMNTEILFQDSLWMELLWGVALTALGAIQVPCFWGHRSAGAPAVCCHLSYLADWSPYIRCRVQQEHTRIQYHSSIFTHSFLQHAQTKCLLCEIEARHYSLLN